MKIDKSLTAGSTTMLLLKLLEKQDMYGYEMIELLEKKSNNIFSLKAGTLYPLLHGLEQKKMVTSYEQSTENTRIRKYYSITKEGKKYLNEKTKEWNLFSSTVTKLMGGELFVPANES